MIRLQAHAAWAVGSRDTYSELANQKHSLTTARVRRHELMHAMASARLGHLCPKPFDTSSQITFKYRVIYSSSHPSFGTKVVDSQANLPECLRIYHAFAFSSER
jgi:hypothetical protein